MGQQYPAIDGNSFGNIDLANIWKAIIDGSGNKFVEKTYEVSLDMSSNIVPVLPEIIDVSDLSSFTIQAVFEGVDGIVKDSVFGLLVSNDGINFTLMTENYTIGKYFFQVLDLGNTTRTIFCGQFEGVGAVKYIQAYFSKGDITAGTITKLIFTGKNF